MRPNEQPAGQPRFDGYDGPIDYTVRNLQVDAEGDLGFCSFLYHVGGTLQSGGQVDMWVRATLCCRRVEGRWRIGAEMPQTGKIDFGVVKLTETCP